MTASEEIKAYEGSSFQGSSLNTESESLTIGGRRRRQNKSQKRGGKKQRRSQKKITKKRW